MVNNDKRVAAAALDLQGLRNLGGKLHSSMQCVQRSRVGLGRTPFVQAHTEHHLGQGDHADEESLFLPSMLFLKGNRLGVRRTVFVQ